LKACGISRHLFFPRHLQSTRKDDWPWSSLTASGRGKRAHDSIPQKYTQHISSRSQEMRCHTGVTEIKECNWNFPGGCVSLKIRGALYPLCNPSTQHSAHNSCSIDMCGAFAHRSHCFELNLPGLPANDLEKNLLCL
jgi:hypothetical protein